MIQFSSRLELFTKQPKNARCVEVGTRYGDLAFEVVNARPDIQLTVVDTWEGKFADGEPIARGRLKDRADIRKASSVNAATYGFDDGCLDFVYIDAAHDYKSVKADLEAWWPKVKRGGMLGGHDYENKPDDGFWGPIEVYSAVNDWAHPLGLKVHSIEPSCPSWWVVKP